MNTHRCIECTLMRCSAVGETCTECQDHLLTQSVAPVIEPGVYVFTWNSVGLGGAQSSPGQAPSSPKIKIYSSIVTPVPIVPPVPSPGRSSANPLAGLGRDHACDFVADFLKGSFHWGSTQKGNAFWQDMFAELRRIAAGGTP